MKKEIIFDIDINLIKVYEKNPYKHKNIEYIKNSIKESNLILFNNKYNSLPKSKQLLILFNHKDIDKAIKRYKVNEPMNMDFVHTYIKDETIETRNDINI